MRKIILFVLLLASTRISAQVCAVVDSFNINRPGIINTDSMLQTIAIAYGNNNIWVSAISNIDQTMIGPADLYIYEFNENGNRLDSIAYSFFAQVPVNALAADDNYLWALKTQTDTLYKYDMATKSLVATYGMGGRGSAEYAYSMASLGDTLYFIGTTHGKCFKFSKSAATFTDYPNYASLYGEYPQGFCGIGQSLVTTTFNSSVSADYISTADPASLIENTSARQNWCLGEPGQLAYGNGYFWALKSPTTLFLDSTAECVYKVQSSFTALGVKEIASAEDFLISPNPVFQTINIKYPTNASWDSFTASIYTVTGAKIYTQQINGGNGRASINVSNLNLSSGIYFIELSNGTQQIMKKVSVL